MKIIASIFVCLVIGLTAFGQPPVTEDISEIKVEEIATAKDDGEGGIGDESESFLPTDIPIHCSIILSSARIATIKLNLVVVKVTGLKAGAKIVTVIYKTKGKQNSVNFNVSPETTWAEGTYRFDILIDGKLSESKEINVAKSIASTAKTKTNLNK